MQDKGHETAGCTAAQMHVFSALWGIATLYHINTVPLDTLTNLLLLISAFLLIRFPGDRRLLLLLAGLQLIDMWNYLPRGSNHWLHTSFLNLIILLLFLTSSARRTPRSPADFFHSLSPYVRQLTMVLYFFAVFHKLNVDFFNASVSCGAILPKLFVQSFTDIHFSSIFGWTGIVATLALETLIPLLLFFRRTAALGTLLGLLFHTMLSLNPALPVADFTSFLLPLYYCFLPENFTTYVIATTKEYRARLPRILIQNSQSATIVFGVFLLAFALVPTVLWLVYTLCVASLIAGYSLSASTPSPSLRFAPPSRTVVLFTALLFFNGMSPHLGLKTELSLSMFSNLRTEFDANHLLMPGSFQLFHGYQNPAVLLESSEESLLRDFALHEGYAHAHFDFDMLMRDAIDRLANEGKSGTLTILYRLGEREIAATYPIEKSSVADRGGRYLLKKLLPFRKIHLSSPTPCNH